MSTSMSNVSETLKRQRSVSTSPTPSPPRKEIRFKALSILELCDAAAKITKMLLGLGAENNWDDVKASHGRSMEAGKYRSNWLYLSSKDRGQQIETPSKEEKSDWLETFNSGVPQTFFYFTPKTESRTHKSYVERSAAAAVLSLTGACDQHAYVLATLLRTILPIGTPISICGLTMAGINFPHTFVVVGAALQPGTATPLIELPLHMLLAVDAWPTIGGAISLKDFFVCDGAIRKGVLLVDKSYTADGTDHLIKRVRKQKILFGQLVRKIILLVKHNARRDPIRIDG